jgi:hypothetical protein
MVRAARVMVTVMKTVMATDVDNRGNGYNEEGNGRLTAATMGTAQRTQPLAL